MLAYQLILKAIFNLQFVSNTGEKLWIVISTESTLHLCLACIAGEGGCYIESKDSVTVLYQVFVGWHCTMAKGFVRQGLSENILLVKVYLKS